MLVLGMKQIKTAILSKSSKPNVGNNIAMLAADWVRKRQPLFPIPSQTQLPLTLGQKIGDHVGHQALLALWLARIMIKYKGFNYACLLMGD